MNITFLVINLNCHGLNISINCSPNNPALLGLNVGGGVQIKLRLRRPNRDWDFFPYDQILDTMLHELCHNEHGPHNASFYKLWDELRKVCHIMVFICKFDGNKNNVIINKSFYLCSKLVISCLMRFNMLVPMIMFYVSSIFSGLILQKLILQSA